MAKKTEKIIKQETPAQRLSGIIKTCRNTMRKDKGMNGDGDRLPMLMFNSDLMNLYKYHFIQYLDNPDYTDPLSSRDSLVFFGFFAPISCNSPADAA